MRPAVRALAGAILIAVVVALLYVGVGWRLKNMFEGDPSTIARASLQAVRQQNRLVPFAARFVAVVTSQESRFGFSAQKTLIMPGLVRCAIAISAGTRRPAR
jgi:hypothetical protein